MPINIKKTIFTAVCALTFSPTFAQRDTISLNFGWQFQLNDSVFDDAKAVTVDLPHDFQISQPWVPPGKDEKADNSDMAANVKSRLSARGFKEMGVGWYRKVLHPDNRLKGRRVTLDFGGIMLVGDVYLNGERIGGTDYGYVGFGIDITKKLKHNADNEIIVRADTRQPDNSRWYTGGGIFRDVRLTVTCADKYFARHPLKITADTAGLVAIESEAYINDRKLNEVIIGARILDAGGKEVASCLTRTKYDRWRKLRTYSLDTMRVAAPRLWSCDSPYLYTAEVTLYSADGTPLDRVSERFGMRSIEFSPEFGFKLNGKKTLLKGTANHHDLGALGAAAYPRAIEKRIKMLKEFGFNHIRASHNPYSEDFYRLCDEYGILVVDEIYDKWLRRYLGGRAEWSELWQHDITEWVKANRNHPSIIMWSLGNELQTYPDLPYGDWGVTPYKLQRCLLRQYDDSRPTTVAMHPRGRSFETDSLPCDLARITDIQSYNYRYMYFPGDRRRFPYMNFYQSEANLSAMGPNFFEMDLDKVIGLAYWGMIEYIGESRGWPAKGWTEGVFDMSLRPKPMAWFVKSMFTDEPLVRIGVLDEKADETVWNGVNFNGDKLSDHWNRTPGRLYTLYTYTNADEVELLVNGRSIGVKRNDKGNPKTHNRIEWKDVAYEPGKVTAIARNGGKEEARHEIKTAGKAVALRLEGDNAGWRADGTDLQHVRVTAVDRKGRRVPTATGEVTFTVEGDARIVAVDNGDITNHEINTLPHIHMYDGTALVILRAGCNGGKITLHAKAGTLKASADFKADKETRDEQTRRCFKADEETRDKQTRRFAL